MPKQEAPSVTEQEYNLVFLEQGGKCGICWHAPGNDRMLLDFDPETKKLRGLLCRKCVAALDLLGQDVHVLRRAVGYVAKRGEVRDRSGGAQMYAVKSGNVTYAPTAAATHPRFDVTKDPELAPSRNVLRGRIEARAAKRAKK